MIDDLELPNSSMTISSLSQSPWQGTKSQQSYRPLNEGGENDNLDSQNKSKQELRNFIGSSLSSNDYSDFKNLQVRPPDYKRTTGSPEFAKELTVTDDLTVSHTDEEPGDGTYR